MVKYILIMFVLGTFLMADDSQQYAKPTPTITIADDDSDKLYRRRRGGKGNKGRRRGGNGLR
jgi:hypothetical protein